MRLERSCDPRRGGWVPDATKALREVATGPSFLQSEAPAHGVARLRARLQREAYATHRHDTYTVALTECGVQEFDYRGGVHRSRAGQVVLLHPDEPHNGRAGTPDGFGYRSLYVEPALLFDAVRAIDRHACALPFVPHPVCEDAELARLLSDAFDGPMEPLRAQAIVWRIARALCRAVVRAASAARAIDTTPLTRARDFLGLHCTRIVCADELEAITGLTRFELCTQFRRCFGTTPYRYLMMRRLDAVRARLKRGDRLSDVALDCGFADQSHMTRAFKAAVGLTPRQFAILHRPPQDPAR